MIFPRAAINVTGEDAGAVVSSWIACHEPHSQEAKKDGKASERVTQPKGRKRYYLGI